MSQPNNTPAPVLASKILCCRGIRVITKKSPSADPAHLAERMMFFLCSHWAGKEIDQDTNASSSEVFSAANFSGVIKVSTEKGADGLPTPPNARWIASYHPDHPKASKLAPIGGRGTGPDGRYMEISESKVIEEIHAGRLIPTNIGMQYATCKMHPGMQYSASWFDFRDDTAAINPSTQLVISGIIGQVSSAGTLKKCNKCKKSTPDGEYRVNIYNGNLTPGHCSSCQGYRHYDEPTRKSRSKASKEMAGNKNTVHDNHTFDNAQNVGNEQNISTDQRVHNEHTFRDNHTFGKTQNIRNENIFREDHTFSNTRNICNNQNFQKDQNPRNDQNVRNKHTFHDNHTFGNAQNVPNAQSVLKVQSVPNAQSVLNAQNPQNDQNAQNNQNVPNDQTMHNDQTVYNEHTFWNEHTPCSNHIFYNERTFFNPQTVGDNSHGRDPASSRVVGLGSDMDIDDGQIVGDSQTPNTGNSLHSMHTEDSNYAIDPSLLDPRLFDGQPQIQDYDDDLYGAD